MLVFKKKIFLLLEKHKIWTVAINGNGVHGCRITPNVYTTLDELDQFVDDLAKRIASFSPHAIALTKQVAQSQGTIEEALQAEHRAFLESARNPIALSSMEAFMNMGGQTREFELALGVDD